MTLSQVILAIALPYFFVSLVLGVVVARRAGGGKLGGQERATATAELAALDGYVTYFVVPCLNEELVVGATVHHLLEDPASRVIVVDDGSVDATAEHARAVARELGASDRLILLERRLPEARKGKGPALNAAFRVLLDDVRGRGLDPDRVIVGVMDADGRLSAGGTRAALPSFDDPRVGGVQLIVRIRNRRKLIAQFQDVEFWMISAMSQFARSLSGTVSLGGNGQFTRLSALLSLEDDPWSTSLTEDLDLGLRLIAAGWRMSTTARAYVDQQAIERYRPLMRQRTRWYQGHMSCMTRLPELWRSDQVSQMALLEVTSYLLVPWLIVLPWSVLQQWVLYQLVFASGRGIVAAGAGPLSWRISYGVLWYTISFLPNIAIGIVYARRSRAVSTPRAILLGHLMILWNYVGYVAVWRGLFRILQRRTGWTKTARTSEDTSAPAAALPEAVAIDDGGGPLALPTG